MCKFCKKPNKTIVKHILGVSAFVGAGLLWLRFYDEKADNTVVSMTAINYCPMCGRNLRSANDR